MSKLIVIFARDVSKPGDEPGILTGLNIANVWGESIDVPTVAGKGHSGSRLQVACDAVDHYLSVYNEDGSKKSRRAK